VNVQFGLTPVDATSAVGTSHTLTARVQENGMPAAGVLITFTVLSGPHAVTTEPARPMPASRRSATRGRRWEPT